MSLRTKVLLPLAIFSTLFIAYIYGYYIPGSRAYMETEYRQSVERHLDTVVEGVIPLLLGRQLDAVYEYLDVLKKRNEDWVTIELIDPVGRTIYPLQSPRTTPKSGSEGQVHAVRQRIEYLNMNLGTIVLNVDFAPRLSDMRKRHQNLAAALFAILFAFMMTSVIIVELAVRRPVDLLARASERLAEGDFNVPLVKTGNDEVGVLVDSFGRMRNAIQENQAELLRKSFVIMRSERKLEEAQRIAHLGGWELDLKNNKLAWSDEIYRIFGMEPQAFGATYEAFLETIHPDDRVDVNAAYTVSLRDGSPYDIVHRIVRKADNETRYVHERCEHVKDDSGKIIRSLGTVQDITERKRAEEALRQREAELNESQRLAHIGSWDWDAKNDTIWWSDEYYRIYGFDPNKPALNYTEHLKAYTFESAERLDVVVKLAMETGEPYEIDLELAQPTPATRWIFARGEAKRDASGKISGLRGTAQNITERKLAEQEIQSAKADLEQRVRERTTDLEKKSTELLESQIALMNIVEDLNEKTSELGRANARLHELDQLKSMFIASMSHELRTPLNSIIGFSSIMLNEWTGPLTAEQKENLAAVLRVGQTSVVPDQRCHRRVEDRGGQDRVHCRGL